MKKADTSELEAVALALRERGAFLASADPTQTNREAFTAIGQELTAHARTLEALSAAAPEEPETPLPKSEFKVGFLAFCVVVIAILVNAKFFYEFTLFSNDDFLKIAKEFLPKFKDPPALAFYIHIGFASVCSILNILVSLFIVTLFSFVIDLFKCRWINSLTYSIFATLIAFTISFYYYKKIYMSDYIKKFLLR